MKDFEEDRTKHVESESKSLLKCDMWDFVARTKFFCLDTCVTSTQRSRANVSENAPNVATWETVGLPWDYHVRTGHRHATHATNRSNLQQLCRQIESSYLVRIVKKKEEVQGSELSVIVSSAIGDLEVKLI